MVNWYIRYLTYRRLVDNAPPVPSVNDQHTSHPLPFFR
jgi:hypothetical protein